MEYNELIDAFAAKCGLPPPETAEGAVVIDFNGIPLSFMDDALTQSLFVHALIRNGFESTGLKFEDDDADIANPAKDFMTRVMLQRLGHAKLGDVLKALSGNKTAQLWHGDKYTAVNRNHTGEHADNPQESQEICGGKPANRLE